MVRTCRWCEAPLVNYRVDAVYCGPPCRAEASRWLATWEAFCSGLRTAQPRGVLRRPWKRQTKR